MTTTLISKKHAAARVSRHPVVIMRMANAGGFPQPVYVGSRVYFVESEIEQWIQNLIDKREPNHDAEIPLAKRIMHNRIEDEAMKNDPFKCEVCQIEFRIGEPHTQNGLIDFIRCSHESNGVSCQRQFWEVVPSNAGHVILGMRREDIDDHDSRLPETGTGNDPIHTAQQGR